VALRDIIGQEQALEILRGSIAKERIAHAYLFTGEDGVGKKLTAINFAKVLNCQKTEIKKIRRWEDKNISTSQPLNFVTSQMIDAKLRTLNSELLAQIDCCEECPSCTKINKSIHPDVFLITPAGGQIKVDVIRKLGESLSYKVFEGRWKIAIIDGAETLNQSAANAFLKTLEEPPDESLLILISSMPEIIPETIWSRCQRINFLPLPLERMYELFEQNSKLQTPNSKLLGILSGGRAGWALSEDLIERRDRAFVEFKDLLSGVEEDLWEGGDSMQEWFEWVHLWLRDIAVFKATNRVDLLINQDKEKDIQDISKKAELNDILKLSSVLSNIRGLLHFNLNKQVILYHTHLLLKKTFTL
jgi:DNA polymerase-3 subunit delta'